MFEIDRVENILIVFTFNFSTLLMFVWSFVDRGILPAIDLMGNHALVGVSFLLFS
jgi:hypothetical protein